MRRASPRITALWRRLKGLYGHYWGQLTIAPTLHGTDVLGEHFEAVKALVLAAKRRHVPADIDKSDLDDFFRRVIERAVLAAMQFDRTKGAAFSTYAFKYIDGAARDWRAEYFGFDLKTGERHAGRSKNICIDTPIGLDDDAKPLTIGDTIIDPGTEYYGEERPSFAEVASAPFLTTKQRDFILGWVTSGGTIADYARSRGEEPDAARQLLQRITDNKNKFR